MKKFMITVLALVAAASVSMAGIGISWDQGFGWAVENGGDLNEGPGVADNTGVLWQLIYAGENNAIDDIDLSAANYLGGDDELLADRTIPAGGGDAGDGTSWDGWLICQDGTPVYENLDFAGKGEYVYQRIFQGETPEAGVWYFETDLFKFDSNYAGGGATPDVFGFDAEGAGVAMDKQIPETPEIPEPATMSLLGLGALAMVIRRKLRK